MAESFYGKDPRATMQKVAARAGVSIATVSHVINGTAKISADTTTRVNSAICELNYRPNKHAQALRKPIAKSIGYLVPDITTTYYSSFFTHFVRYAYESECSVFTINYRHNPTYEITEFQNLVDKNVDAILLHNGFDDTDALEIANRANIPLILLDRHQDNSFFIAFDNTRTIQRLVSLLKLSGYRRIGYISESVIVQNLNDRYIGYLKGMQENGLETDTRNVLINRQPEIDTLSIGYQLMRRWLAKSSASSLAEVFIASSDLIAFGAMRAIREAGMRIPEDIAITGCDNSQISDYMQPPLTTIQQSPGMLAKHAWDMLEKIFSYQATSPIVETLPQTLVIRESAVIPLEILQLPEFADFIELKDPTSLLSS